MLVKLAAFIVMVLLSGTAASSRMPEGAWDSHIHVIDPERFPMAEDRDYTPKAATVANATEFEQSRGIKHATIVLPSVYDTNNSVLLDALKQTNGSYRGVAVIDPDNISNATLAEMHQLGVRGLRVNLAAADVSTDEIVSQVKQNAAVAKLNNWALQLWVPVSAYKTLHSVIPNLGVTVVADHYARAQVGSKTNVRANTYDPYMIEGFSEVVDLVQRKLLFVKISAPYQCSTDAPLYEDMRIVAQTLMLAGPDMVVYGSDWPHTSSKEGNAAAGGRLVPQDFRDINDTALVETVQSWCGSDAQVQRMFVDNPRRLWQWYSDE